MRPGTFLKGAEKLFCSSVALRRRLLGCVNTRSERKKHPHWHGTLRSEAVCLTKTPKPVFAPMALHS